MDRITCPTAVASLPTYIAPPPGSITGHFAGLTTTPQGLPPTQVTAQWLEAVQEEIMNVILFAGLTPGLNVYTQLRQAISILVSGAVPNEPAGQARWFFTASGTPTGYLACDGSAVSRTTYSGLFSAIGTTYGAGNGSTTFNLPDARGRTLISNGQGTGLTNRTPGQAMGEERHLMTLAELVQHEHLVPVSNGVGSVQLIQGQENQAPGTYPTNPTGGSQPFNVMQPSLVARLFIKT